MEIIVKRRCHCIRKNDIEASYEVEASEANAFAQTLLNTINDNNCSAHRFFLEEKEGVIILNSTLNGDTFSLE